jgi:glycosyltransferase involved in cell wall biosynthesis
MISGSISVIIPCYCCSEVLPRAVDSVLKQSLLPCEIILIDDASPDQGKTRKCIEDMLAQPIAHQGIEIRAIFLEINLGPGGARNAGWDIARGELIAFLDADDSWAPDKLSIQSKWMLFHPDFGMSFHDTCHIADLKLYDPNAPIRYREIKRAELLIKNMIPTRSVMLLNRAEFRFHSNMRYAEDYRLWLDIKSAGVRVSRLLINLAFTYKSEYGEGGLSANLYEMHAGVLRCYSELWREKKINSFEFLFI